MTKFTSIIIVALALAGCGGAYVPPIPMETQPGDTMQPAQQTCKAVLGAIVDSQASGGMCATPGVVAADCVGSVARYQLSKFMSQAERNKYDGLFYCATSMCMNAAGNGWLANSCWESVIGVGGPCVDLYRMCVN